MKALLKFTVLVYGFFCTSIFATTILSMEEGHSQLLNFEEDISSIFISDPAISDAHSPSNRSVLIYGIKSGQTDMVVVGHNGKPLGHYRVDVRKTGIQILQRNVALLYPDEKVKLAAVGEVIAVSGEVSSPQVAQGILSMVNSFAMQRIDNRERFKELSSEIKRQQGEQREGPGGQMSLPLVVNKLTIKAASQVNISIRMVEMARSTSEELGIRWQAVNPNWMLGISPANQLSVGADISNADSVIKHNHILGIIDALASKSLVTVLAEPNLTAKSGEKAEFLVGGEFPFPTLDGESAGVEFKSFGVGLAVTPTVLSESRISLTVTPEVSALSRQNSVQINGINIPGLDKRTATTTIELADGQSFALAGMLRNSEENTVESLPFLGDIPGLGALFRTNKTNQIERELVIIATASLVKPVSDIDDIPTPLDNYRTPTRFERLFFGDIHGKEQTPRLLGDYGYQY